MADVVSGLSSSLSTTEVLVVLLATDRDDNTWPLVSCALCLLACFLLPCSLIATKTKLAERDDTITNGSHIQSLQTFHTLFSYKWANASKMDVESTKLLVSKELQKSLESDLQSNAFKKKNSRVPKVEWNYLFFLNLALFIILFFPVGAFFG
ncbi:hypothetical protein GEMRC1_004985 [Eukaryota sp. GEM-RC1]